MVGEESSRVDVYNVNDGELKILRFSSLQGLFEFGKDQLGEQFVQIWLRDREVYGPESVQYTWGVAAPGELTGDDEAKGLICIWIDDKAPVKHVIGELARLYGSLLRSPKAVPKWAGKLVKVPILGAAIRAWLRLSTKEREMQALRVVSFALAGAATLGLCDKLSEIADLTLEEVRTMRLSTSQEEGQNERRPDPSLALGEFDSANPLP